MRFLRNPITLSGVTFDARADHVFPGGSAAAVARHDMIKVQIASIKTLAAVLAGVLITLKNIVACKFHFFFW